MKIAHIGEYTKDVANGVQVVINQLLKIQSEMGHEVYLYSFDLEDKKIFSEYVNGINIVHFPKLKCKGFISHKIIKEYIISNKDNIDIFHLHSVYLPTNCTIAKIIKEANIPYILSPHGGYNIKNKTKSNISFIKKSIFNKIYEERFVNDAHKLYALTQKEERDLKLQFDNDNISIIPNGSNGVKNIENIDNKKFNLHGEYMVYCGRLDVKHKGIDLLIESYNRAIKQYPELNSLKLAIVGPQKGMKKDLKKINKLIDKYNLSNKVILTGGLYGKEKDEIIKKSLFYIQCSRWEGFGLSIIEAIELKKPVLITESCDISSYLKKYDYGIVSKLDITDLSSNIKEMYFKSLDKNYISEIAIKSELILNNEFNWTKIVEKMCEEYTH